MRKLLLISAILIFNFSFSQDYIPILQEGNQWHRMHCSYWEGCFEVIDFTILGEEEINGEVYKIIYRNGIMSSCRLREENGLVYSYSSYSNTEKLMLDLTLEIGDVLNEEYFCMGGGSDQTGEYRVVDVYVDFIAGADRKVIVIDGFDFAGFPIPYTEYWIEGIGSLNGLSPFGNYYDFGTLLTCFSHNGEITYFNGYTTCNPIISTEDFTTNKTFLSPNPVTNISTLQLPAEASVDRIKIYDFSGKLVKEVNINSDYYTINATDFVSGLYFYQVFSDQNLIGTQRFIVK